MATGNGSTAWICTCIRDERPPGAVAVPDPECPRHGTRGEGYEGRIVRNPRHAPVHRNDHGA